MVWFSYYILLSTFITIAKVFAKVFKGFKQEKQYALFYIEVDIDLSSLAPQTLRPDRIQVRPARSLVSVGKSFWPLWIGTNVENVHLIIDNLLNGMHENFS